MEGHLIIKIIIRVFSYNRSTQCERSASLTLDTIIDYTESVIIVERGL